MSKQNAKEIPGTEYARRLTSFAKMLNLDGFTVEYGKSWGDLYRIEERSGTLSWWETPNEVSAILIQMAREKLLAADFETDSK